MYTLYVLAQCYSKKTKSQPPLYNINHWGSYRPFLSKNCSCSKYNIYTLHHCNSSLGTKLKNIPDKWPLTVASNGHFDYLLVYYLLSTTTCFFNISSLPLQKDLHSTPYKLISFSKSKLLLAISELLLSPVVNVTCYYCCCLDSSLS